MSDLMERLAELDRTMTPGPWFDQPTEHEPPRGMVYGPDGDSMFDIQWNPGNDYDPIATAAGIAALRNALPEVIAALRAERAAGDAPLDVERLARAIGAWWHYPGRRLMGAVAEQAVFRGDAEIIAREYARLASGAADTEGASER